MNLDRIYDQERRVIREAIILAMLYLAVQMIADVSATKLIFLLGLALPAGSFIYALSFTIRDLVHKRLGKEAARLMILTAGAINVAMAAYFMFVGKLPAPTFWQNQAAYDVILGVVPRIVIASIVAEVISELIDTEVYSLWVKHVTTEYQWSRILVSNVVAAPVDSIFFASIAFGGTIPMAGIVSLVLGQVAFKYALGLLSLPSIYLVKER